ncbi:MAG TPA: hypothetical protein VIG08_09120 [Gemmatimonadales bacterium]|jgi:hypothetical protein
MTGSTFPAIQKAVDQQGMDPSDRDAFLLLPDVVTMMHDLRPDEGAGDAMEYLVALGHHAYLTWAAGSLTLRLGPETTEALLLEHAAVPAVNDVPKAYYAQFLEHQIWASVIDDQTAEPLDGVFVHSTPAGDLRALGIFGLRPERGGFTAVETDGPRPESLARSDGSALFSSTLGGGHLHSITGGEELLELAWRTLRLAHEAWAKAA